VGDDWFSGKVQEPIRLESRKREHGTSVEKGKLKRDAGRGERWKEWRNEVYRRKKNRLDTSSEVKGGR